MEKSKFFIFRQKLAKITSQWCQIDFLSTFCVFCRILNVCRVLKFQLIWAFLKKSNYFAKSAVKFSIFGPCDVILTSDQNFFFDFCRRIFFLQLFGKFQSNRSIFREIEGGVIFDPPPSLIGGSYIPSQIGLNSIKRHHFR